MVRNLVVCDANGQLESYAVFFSEGEGVGKKNTNQRHEKDHKNEK
jgi:hypothetical protein